MRLVGSVVPTTERPQGSAARYVRLVLLIIAWYGSALSYFIYCKLFLDRPLTPQVGVVSIIWCQCAMLAVPWAALHGRHSLSLILHTLPLSGPHVIGWVALLICLSKTSIVTLHIFSLCEPLFVIAIAVASCNTSKCHLPGGWSGGRSKGDKQCLLGLALSLIAVLATSLRCIGGGGGGDGDPSFGAVVLAGVVANVGFGVKSLVDRSCSLPVGALDKIGALSATSLLILFPCFIPRTYLFSSLLDEQVVRSAASFAMWHCSSYFVLNTIDSPLCRLGLCAIEKLIISFASAAYFAEADSFSYSCLLLCLVSISGNFFYALGQLRAHHSAKSIPLGI